MEIHENPDALPSVTFAAPLGSVTVAWRNVAMMLGHWQLRGYGQWAVVEQATNEVIGRVGFYNPEGWPGIELGWIIRRSRWGNGFATEAAMASLRWAADNLDANEVISLVKAENAQSIRIATKLGARFSRTVVLGADVLQLYTFAVHS